MYFLRKLLLFPIPFLIAGVLNAQLNQEVEAKIAGNSRGSSLLLNILGINKTPINKSLSYRISIVRNEELGEKYEKEDIEDLFVLAPQERRILKTILFNPQIEPRTIIFVLIYEEGNVIGKDRYVINALEGEETFEPMVVQKDSTTKVGFVPSDVGLMRGIVVEDTKTKPGRDFYRMFYSLYNQYNINGDRIVKVREELAIGGNTEILIEVEQEVVVRFIVNPRSDYLEEVSKRSVAIVANHFEQREKFKNQQKRY